MQLGYRFGHSHNSRHRAKGPALKIHIEARNYYTYSLIGQLITHTGQFIIKKLRFINTHHLHLAPEQ